jgi:predicted phosphodiesterase
VQLIALNSNQFDREGNQLGCLDEEQLQWLEQTLFQVREKLVLITIHHNAIEHIPGQSSHELGRRYMLDNAETLLKILHSHGVKLIFSGHLHIQDLAEVNGIYEITTGSLVSYPHPYRIVEVKTNVCRQQEVKIESYRLESLPGWENLAETSREVMGDRSYPFMLKLLTSPPLNLPIAQAQKLAPQLRYFWTEIAAGDAIFDFADFPVAAQQHLQKFGAIALNGTPALIDNRVTLTI